MSIEKLFLDYIRLQSEADSYIASLNDIFGNMNKYLEENGEEQLNLIIDNLKISLENARELAADAYSKYTTLRDKELEFTTEALTKRENGKKTLAFTYNKPFNDEYNQ